MRRASKLLSLLLALTLSLGICASAGAEYSDTSGHWAESAIDRWSAYGIISGDGNGFNPDGNLTCGQMAKVLSETLGLTKQGDNPFADVSADAWYTPYILRCYEAGIMLGDGTNANPNAAITREQAMVMLCRALGIAPASEGALASFTDSGNVASWAAPYVAAMVQSGIVSGVGSNTLAPAGNISRAALMTILDRSIVQYINEPGSYELTNKAGIVLVAAGDVTLTGATSADVLVSPAAEGKAVAFDGATVTGSVTVQAENAKVTSENSTLPNVSFTGTGAVEVAVNSEHGAAVTKDEGATVGVSSELETPPTVTVDDEIVYIHKWGPWEKVDDNSHKRVCQTDGSHVEEESHPYPAPVKVDGENHRSVCPDCGYELVTPHTVAAIGEAVAATCLEDGMTAGSKCTACNAVLAERQTIKALGHDFSGDYQNDEAGHWRKCSRCEATEEKAAHTYSEGTTCDTAAACKVCGYERAVGEHTWDDGEQTKAPTCMEAGEKTFTCASCKQTKTEELAATGHTEAIDSAVPATCTEKGKTEGKHCSVCNAVIIAQTETAALDHSWNDGVVTQEPTDTTEGVKTFTCTACGATKTESVPATGEKNVWFEKSYESLKVCWKDAGLGSGEYYTFSIDPAISSYISTASSNTWTDLFSCFDHIIDTTEDKSYTLTINKRGDDHVVTPLYSTTFNVIVSGDTGGISLAGQEDGTYWINSDFVSQCFAYRFIRSTVGGVGGSNQSSENVTKLSQSLYDGDEIAIQYHSFEITNDGRSVTITVSPYKVLTVENGITLCTAPPEAARITDPYTLESALKKGGDVYLDADIEIDNLNINTGAPATLRLNGHTLTVGRMDITNAKQLTIDGSKSGSEIIVSGSGEHLASVKNGSKLMINGGTYGGNGLDLFMNAAASITGGTFKFDPSAYVEPNTHDATKNADQTWTVTAKETP